MYSPAPEAPAHMQAYPQYLYPAISIADKFFQVTSHEYQQRLMSLFDATQVARKALLL